MVVDSRIDLSVACGATESESENVDVWSSAMAGVEKVLACKLDTSTR